ncbi:hypothetical protein HWV62_40112 [Athelia sp. TMB]|nr:hypothetical protein HWV62_40112 [Athelia sp. TMB]
MSLHVYVRDPPFALQPPPSAFGESVITGFEHPEGQLGFSLAPKNRPRKNSMIPRYAPPVENIPAMESKVKESKRPKSRDVPKKQRSLQSIFIPSFLQSPPPNIALPTASGSQPRSRVRSQSAPRRPSASTLITTKAKTSPNTRSGSPSQFLIDEDPFASASTLPMAINIPTSPPPDASGSGQRSPTSPPAATDVLPVLPPSSPTPSPVRPKSSGNAQSRGGAYTKPAFTSRPSLPSLHSLSQMNVVIPKKVCLFKDISRRAILRPVSQTRKGTVGARLPYEPWNLSPSQLSPNLPSSGAASASSGHKFRVPSVADFTLSLDAGLSDVASHLELEDENDEEEHDLRSLYRESIQSSVLDSMPDSVLDSMPDSVLDSTDTESYAPSLSYTPSESDISSFGLSRSSSLSQSSSTSWAALDRLGAAHSSSGHPLVSPSPSQSEFPNPHQDTRTEYTFERYPDHDPLQSEPDFDYYYWGRTSAAEVREKTTPPSPPADPGRTPHTSFYHVEDPQAATSAEELLAASPMHLKPGDDLEPGTSANTIRSSLHGAMRPDSPMISLVQNSLGQIEEPIDGDSWNRGNSGSGDQYYRRDQSRGRGNSSAGGTGQGSSGLGGQGSGGGSGGGRDDRGGDDRKSRRPDIYSAASTTPNSDDEEEASTDDYGDQSQDKIAIRARAQPRATESPTTGTDDDMPLAQRIPTALKAQKTIRKQVRDERDQRRKEKAEASARKRQNTVPSVVQPVSTQSFSSRLLGRVRTKTMPSSTPRPFAAEDLTQKLLGVQATGSIPAATSQPRSPLGNSSFDHENLGKNLFVKSRSSRPTTADSASREQVLRAQRSLHSLSAAPARTSQENSSRGLGRSNTKTRRPDDGYLSAAPPTSFHLDGRSSTDRPKSRRTSDEASRPSHSSARPSAEYSSGQRSGSRPPMPPLPPAEVLSNMAMQSPPKVTVAQQRIFIGDKQRYNTVETTPSTTAGEVVQMIEQQGELEQLKGGVGGWMLWEVSQDFGMERPMRDYELLSDVESAWIKDKMVNIFVVKKSPMSNILARSNVPSSSPRTSGYIDWESKKGKWSKRYMELREHSLWLSKKDGKDENFLCALSNFDVYYVGKHKAPKPFVFAVKSTENISLFESASDYVHYFCASQRDGETWMQAILLARSYVLYQERNVLFSGGNSGAPVASKGLSRAGTRKDRPIQPLIDVAASLAAVQSPQGAVFEPGSLLARRTPV